MSKSSIICGEVDAKTIPLGKVSFQIVTWPHYNGWKGKSHSKCTHNICHKHVVFNIHLEDLMHRGQHNTVHQTNLIVFSKSSNHFLIFIII